MANKHNSIATYVNDVQYKKFLQKCKDKDITPYQFLKNKVIEFIEAE